MELTIEVTSRCHNRCVHCSSGSSPDCNEFIDKNIIAKAIESLAPDKVILSGGEPFLHPEIRDIIYIARKCPVLAVNTCGVFRYSNAPVNITSIDEFYVSWFLDDNETITGFEPPLQFEHPFSLIAWLKGSGIEKIWINTVVLGLRQVTEIPRACYDLGVPVHVMRCIYHGRAKSLNFMTIDHQRYIAESIIDQLDPAKARKRPPSFLCRSRQEVLPEDIKRLEAIHPKCKISHAFYPEKCRSSTKRTMLVNGRIIGCVAGKGIDERDDVRRVCDSVIS